MKHFFVGKVICRQSCVWPWNSRHCLLGLDIFGWEKLYEEKQSRFSDGIALLLYLIFFMTESDHQMGRWRGMMSKRGDEGVSSAKGEIKGCVEQRADEGVWSAKGEIKGCHQQKGRLRGVLSKGQMKGCDQQKGRWRGVISKRGD